MSVSIRNVSKEFDRYPALHDTALDIASGELLALLGPSGSGKTTLLRLIAGLETPSTGQIFLHDVEASRTPVQHRQVGFVFQHYALFRHMTVMDNIRFGMSVRPRSRRPSKAEQKRRALELLELVQLSGLENRFPAQLSGGQRQRVALARAMAIEPKVLLLDEPFGALDAQVRKELRSWLREIHDRTGHTTVFVTHDQEEALELSDRVVVMSKGRIEQIGSPDDVYDRPETPFVHGFIGESAELPVTLSGGAVLFGDRPTGLRGTGTGPAKLFFRPHAIEVVDGPGTTGAIGGVVRGVRRIAGVRRLDLDVVGAAKKVEIDVPVGHPATAGSTVTFRPTRFRLYPDAGFVGDSVAVHPRLVVNG